MSVDHPFVAILICKRFNQCRITSCNLRFGHSEARPSSTFAQRSQVFFFLFRSRPVQQRVLIAFVRCLGIEHEWSDTDLGCLCRNSRHRCWPQSHSTPFGRHMRKPQFPIFSSNFAQLHDRLNYLCTIMLINCIPFRTNHSVHKLAHLHPHFFDLRWEREINHLVSLPDQVTLPRVGFWS